MKTPKLISALIAIFLFSNLLFAGNPVKGNPDNIASKMVEKLSKDVTLTDAQKTALQTKAKEFAAKRQQANALTNEADKLAIKKKASDEYKAAIDSICTPEQRAQITQKKEDRKKNSSDKFTTKK
jgi:Spy/CpxP family protein refolding chaperone